MIVRLLIYILLGFVAYSVYQGVRRALNAPRPRPPEQKARGEEMVRDPRCGTYLPKAEAIETRVAGETHYFCSAECRQAYQDQAKT
ncbi:MAG TPA: PP0621 family protein [Desulfuromonadales bacterium]|nr:PP0621 family protein [Desulfuromonadales bacterium]